MMKNKINQISKQISKQLIKLAICTSLTTQAFSFTCPTYDKSARLAQLTPLQYEVTQKAATEPAYHNVYWHNEKPGIYVDIISGQPLFSSLDKFDSGTGWPSFSQPISPKALKTKVDYSFFFIKRTEVLGACSDAHLGHVFNDGPKPTGLRYCINSAALRFIPVDQLAAQGYADYLGLFDHIMGDAEVATVN